MSSSNEIDQPPGEIAACAAHSCGALCLPRPAQVRVGELRGALELWVDPPDRALHSAIGDERRLLDRIDDHAKADVLVRIGVEDKRMDRDDECLRVDPPQRGHDVARDHYLTFWAERDIGRTVRRTDIKPAG